MCAQVKAAKLSAEDANSALQSAQDEVSSLQRHLATNHDTISSWKSKAESAQRQVAAVEQQLDFELAQHHRLLEDSQAAAAKLQSEARTLRSRQRACEAAEQQQQSLQTQLEAAQKGQSEAALRSTRSLSSQLKDSQDKVNRLQQQLADAEGTSEQQHAAATAAKQEATALRKQLQAAKLAVQAATAVADEAQQQAAVLRGELDSATELAMSPVKARADAAQRQVRSLQAQLQASQQEKATLEEQRAELQQQADDKASLPRRAPVAPLDTPSQRKQLQAARAAAAEAQEVANNFQAELEASQDAAAVHKGKADAAQRQVRSLQAQQHAKQEEIESLAAQLEEVHAHSDQQMLPRSNQVHSQHAEHALLRQQLQTAKSAAAQAEDASSSLQSQLESSQQLSSTHKARADAAQRQVQGLQAQLAMLEQLRTTAEANSAQHQQSMHSMQLESRRLQQELDSSRALGGTPCPDPTVHQELPVLQSQVARAKQDAASAQSKAEAGQQRVAKLQAELDMERQGSVTQQAACLSLKADLAAAQQAKATAEQRLGTLQVGSQTCSQPSPFMHHM